MPRARFAQTFLAVVALAVVSAAPMAGAQTLIGDTVVFERTPTVAELEDAFGLSDAERDSGKRTRSLSRSIRLHDAPAQTAAPKPAPRSGGAQAQPLRATAPAAPLPGKSVGILVNFAHDSADLLLSDARSIETIGEFLTKNAGVQMLIAGHADASGGARYNDELSLRRAAAVRTYLSEAFDISGDRLKVAGLGERRLLPGLPPLAAKHRRVEFRIIN